MTISLSRAASSELHDSRKITAVNANNGFSDV